MNFDLLGWGDAGWGDEFVRGTLMTVLVAGCSFTLSLVFGSLFAACKLSRSYVLKGIAEVYTTVLRGVPELLIIYLLFFGGNLWVTALLKGMFGFEGRVELPKFLTGVVCLALTSGAYSTEIIRGAVQAIPRGQIEAAKAIGMGTFLRLRRVIIPQAARFALPGLSNVWQISLKDTSLISVIGLVEIMRTARLGAGSTRDSFTFYLAALLLFLVLAYLSQQVFIAAEKRADRGVRRV